MLSLDDPRWKHLEGGYRIPYDAAAVLSKLEAGGRHAEIWTELWNELHHQGSVGTASYAAVPHLVAFHLRTRSLDWNLYALAATIEVERHRRSNPPIPDWLLVDYQQAWRSLVEMSLDDLRAASVDAPTLESALAVIALGKGALKLGALLNHLDDGEVDEFVDEHLEWREIYRDGAA